MKIFDKYKYNTEYESVRQVQFFSYPILEYYTKKDSPYTYYSLLPNLRIHRRIHKRSSVVENNGINNKFILLDDNGKPLTQKYLKNLKLKFLGNNNTVIFYASTELISEIIITCTSNNLVNVKKTKYHLNFSTYNPLSENSSLIIGEDTSIEHATFILWDEPNLKIEIGDNCMISHNVVFRPSDGHTILDNTGNILNYPKNIYLGKHCWVGSNVTFLKGSCVPNNSIIGINSLYTSSSNPKEKYPLGAIFAGSPAKMIRTAVNWDRDNTYVYKNRLNTI